MLVPNICNMQTPPLPVHPKMKKKAIYINIFHVKNKIQSPKRSEGLPQAAHESVG